MSQPLPEGWQESTDQWGRAFYIDHNNGRTQWERPSADTADEKPAAPPAYNDVAPTPAYESAGQPSVDGASGQAFNQAPLRTGVPPIAFTSSSTQSTVVATRHMYTTVNGVRVAVPALAPEPLETTRRRADEARELYAAGAQTPVLVENRNDRVLVSSFSRPPITPESSLPPKLSRVGPDGVTFYTSSDRSVCGDACKATPCAFVFSVIQLILMAVMITMIVLLVSSESDSTYPSRRTDNLRYLPGVMAPGVILFIILILQCSVHLNLACVPRSVSLGRATSTPSVVGPSTSVDAEAGLQSCGGPFSAIARSISAPPATMQDAIEFIDLARTAAVEVKIRVRGGQPSMNSDHPSTVVWTDLATATIPISAMHDATMPRDRLSAALNGGRHRSFFAVVSHSFEIDPENYADLESYRAQLEQAYAGHAPLISAVIEMTALVSPKNGVVLVQAPGVTSNSSLVDSTTVACCVCLTCTPCYSCLWHTVPSIRIGAVKRLQLHVPQSA